MNESKKEYPKASIWHKYNQIILIYLFTILIILISFILDEDFMSTRNLNNLLLTVFPIAMVGFAQTLIILMADIDLSLGSMLSLINVVCVALMQTGMHWTITVPVAILTGIVCGAFNGVFISYFKLPSVVVTIATLSIFRGIALYISPIPGGKVDGVFSKLLTGKLGFPTPLVLLAVVIILLTVLTNKTRYGKRLRACGGSEVAAYVTGINVKKIKFITYCLAGFIVSIASIFLTAQMRTGDATVGTSYTTNSIAVTVVGGTLLTGAVGEVIGTLAGAFIIVIINNILNLSGVTSFYQYVFQGLVLIAALGISSLRARK